MLNHYIIQSVELQPMLSIVQTITLFGYAASLPTNTSFQSDIPPRTVEITSNTLATNLDLPIHPYHQCGNVNGDYYRCSEGNCCSPFGYCGISSLHCTECQSAFGYCPKST